MPVSFNSRDKNGLFYIKVLWVLCKIKKAFGPSRSSVKKTGVYTTDNLIMKYSINLVIWDLKKIIVKEF